MKAADPRSLTGRCGLGVQDEACASGKRWARYIKDRREQNRAWEESEIAVTDDKDKLEISANNRSGGLMGGAWA